MRSRPTSSVNMVDQDQPSHSRRISPRHSVVSEPVGPLHSAHHSFSSTSSRSPLQPLSLHEYRKQQNTPTSLAATPPGKTLRRKAAASTLNSLEHVSSAYKTRASVSRSSYCLLHPSQSAPRLSAYQQLPPSPPFQEDTEDHSLPSRSQSAEPRSSRGHDSHDPSTSQAEGFYRDFNPTQKVSSWKSIKRLPKPQVSPSLSHHVFRQSNGQSRSIASPIPALRHLSPVQTCLSTGNPPPTGEQATPSSFSLTQFPQPSHLTDLSFSPPNEHGSVIVPRVNISFTSTAPVTPPATPAVVHYRGTSFDVVNPHASLLLHNIETPTRDSNSPEYFVERSSEDPLFDTEMAPKRPLYGDFSQAYTSITRRADESPGTSQVTLPLPPDPVAQSRFSKYSSPQYEPELAVSPLTIRKPTESRFSLKQLTRNLTKRIAKTPDLNQHGQELDEIATSPIDGSGYHSERLHPLALGQSSRSAPLPSLIPADSVELGRGAEARISMSDGDLGIDPYYDMDSMYPSSSIYTGDGKGSYPPSLADKHRSNPYRLSHYVSDYKEEIAALDQHPFAEARRESRRASRPVTQEQFRSTGGAGDHTDTLSKVVGYYEGPSDGDQDLALMEEARELDYNRLGTNSGSFTGPARPQMVHASSGLSKFEFDFNEGDETGLSNSPVTSPSASETRALQHAHRRYPTIGRSPGAPPQQPPPAIDLIHQGAARRLAPSDVFSGASSYGDTRQLLHLSQPFSAVLESPTSANDALHMPQDRLEPSSSYSQPDGAQYLTPQGLQPSSSYSQPEVPHTPTTPREALDQAEQIFEEAGQAKEKDGIPSIWTRRSSGSNLLRSKSAIDDSIAMTDDAARRDGAALRASVGTAVETAISGDDRDWETLPRDNSPRMSLQDSTADYSDATDELPSFDSSSGCGGPAHDGDRQSAAFCCSPSPVATRIPFNSSPPFLKPPQSVTSPQSVRSPLSVRSVPNDGSSSPYYKSPRASTTVPLFQSRLSYRNHPDHYKPVPNIFAAGLSDRETQELLNSGPNDEILYDEGLSGTSNGSLGASMSGNPQTTSSMVAQRENTFEKFSVLGPKANLTGSPLGTGMHEVGSSVADLSSPGAGFESTPSRSQSRPSILVSSSKGKERADDRSPLSLKEMLASPEHQRTPSAQTMFPSHLTAYKAQGALSPDGADDRSISSRGSRGSLKAGLSLSRPGHSRPAVAHQTKLREMMLVSSNTTLSSTDTRFSRFMMNSSSEVASSTPTVARLHTQQSSAMFGRNLATENSPHLLCAERQLSPEMEREQLFKSKVVFACFCLLPPLLLLYHLGYADWIVMSWSKGELPGCHPRYKRVAKWTAGAATATVAILILAPVLAVHATGRL
ncbi:hypothetical protein GQ43DRAFT_3702 [Delitschia confertaspora ATCC 74209]|uniref:Uncharacterized protein n=1 Tax=Delitschia confertaspora ATCC 74209 TaxID=1513339 RepID=A0A9P4JYT9_9PLEO|nr:hypothetical protein GQ43DRAFT_3702 [Delitschia confertaspora ATCC 74209]